MERNQEFEEYIRDLMPDATDVERNMAADRLDEYIRILMQMAERMEAAEFAKIRGNPDRGV